MTLTTLTHNPHNPRNLHNPRNPHNPNISHDSRIRPLADFAAAAAAGCAPQHNVIAPHPEKTWPFERRSWPFPVSVCPRPPMRADCGCCRLRADFPLDSSQPHRRALPAGPELTILNLPSLPFDAEVPAIQIADSFDDVPRPPPPPSDDAIIQNTINIGTMFGAENDPTNLFLRVNTAANLYANFVNTTFKSLNQRHFRTIPSPRYAQLPDKHHFFDGAWNNSTHPAHQDIMAEIRVRTWAPDLQAIASAFTQDIPSQLSQQQQETWFENIGMNGDGEDAEGME
ncbi:hypothetical protein EJ07DRAFT_150608 [Lizonia empirigonia]|nr:hypothetical protein EJ07DRAFT_150608 [Lizonia empirigonia]